MHATKFIKNFNFSLNTYKIFLLLCKSIFLLKIYESTCYRR
jgi:hypothetical protein